MTKIIRTYIEKLIVDNPKLYGGDNSNDTITKRYIEDVGKDYRYSTLESIVRYKNIFLTNNPQYDFRVKNKGKNTGTVPTVEVV